jgi:hypothetical protein
LFAGESSEGFLNQRQMRSTLMASKIIFFELNEVPSKVLQSYCSWRPNGFLAQTLKHCDIYNTYSEDGRLSPWTTWPTLHRGVVDQAHTIHNFGQDLTEIDREFPPVWQILANSGISTGVFGSLHTYPMPKNLENYSFFIPDTFAAGSECFPKNRTVFQDFNLAMARDSARSVSTKIHWAPALRFLAQAPNLGLKLSTVVDIGGHLISERLQSWRKVRRRTYQSVLAFDLYMKLLEETKPAFSTFFTNHVASSQHRYWAAIFPTDYDSFEFTDEWVNTYRNEIDFTMSKFEGFFKRLVHFVNRNPDYALWVTTSMGQEATEAKAIETELAITDVGKFMKTLGVPPEDWSPRPAMVPQISVFVTDSSINQFRENLQSLTVNGEPILVEERESEFFSITCGYPNLHDKEVDIRLNGVSVTEEMLGWEYRKLDDKCGATAYHIPEGLLFTYEPRSNARTWHNSEISTRDIVPEILNNFGIRQPDYMSGKSFRLALTS